jgi:predicted permease
VYIPIGQWKDPTFRDRKASMMFAVGRLKPHVTIAQAKADMDGVARHMAEEYPDADKGTGITLVPLKQSVVGDVQPYLLLLLATVGFVLLIACVNVASLSLARSTGRTHQFAIRIALGAGRRRLVRQLLTESVLLGIAGGGLGLLIASWGLQGALKALPQALPRAQEVRLDGHVLLFTLVISILAGILFGLAPALKTSTVGLHEMLQEGARGSIGMHHRTQGAFVVVEVALAVVLLAGAGLMIRSLAKLWSVDPGFDPHHVLTALCSFPLPKSVDAARETWREIHNRLAALPGIEAASLTINSIPLKGESDLPFWLANQPKPASDSHMKDSVFYLVQPDYLKVMKIPLERGRFLTSSDTQYSPFVTVIDQDFAKLYFPNQNPIGQRVSFGVLGQTAEIVGVVGHIKQWGLNESAASPILAQCYFAAAQLPDRFVPLLGPNLAITVRIAGSPVVETHAVRHAIEQVNSQAVVFDAETMEEIISGTLSSQRFSMILMAIFAGLALIMASVGIYGVISYVTSHRVHEIGIRLALGAQRADILRMIMGQGLRLALIGVAIGIVGAVALTRFLSSLLFGVKPTDLLTFIAVSLILTSVALVASYIPARRATKVDPILALHYE